MNCIICGKEIKSLETISDYRISQGVDYIISGMYEDAAVHEFICGYGSRFDGDHYIIGICDNCLEYKIKKGLIQLI